MSETQEPSAMAAPVEEAKREFECTAQHGIKHRGKRIRASAKFDAFPSEMKPFLDSGLVEDVEVQKQKHQKREAEEKAMGYGAVPEEADLQTSANTATGHSEDQEEGQ